MRAEKNMILREIAGEYLLVPVNEAAMRIKGMVILTESGCLLWKRLQNDCTEEDLVQAILAEYEIDAETARADVKEFLQKMDKAGILLKD